MAIMTCEWLLGCSGWVELLWVCLHLLDRYHEEELQEHIDKLHEYNEIKDIGQLLIGKLGQSANMALPDHL